MSFYGERQFHTPFCIAMSHSSWHFRRKKPSDTAREPISSEFFSDESVEDSASALVRESIQNSLDARRNGPGSAIEVRVCVGTDDHSALPSAIGPFFENAWPHLAARGNGLVAPPQPRERCSFLTIEDFGTSGLEGDPLEWKPSAGGSNSFYAFFRAEAFSEKSGDDRGRWGVGKLVFPRASRASAFFGLTVAKSQARTVLMGRMILRHHDVAGVTYVPDAAFGALQEVHGDPDFVIPSSDAQLIRDFSSTFGITRSNEPGLSIVVPWLDEERAFAPMDLARAIASEYFLPILKGQLVVRIRHGSSTIALDRASLLTPEQSWFDESLTQTLSLARFASQSQPAECIDIAPPDQRHSIQWPEQALPADSTALVRSRLEQGETLAFRIPVRVDLKTKAQARQHSELFVFLRAADSGTSVNPVFIREGIRISNAKGKSLPSYASLVTIEDGALATLLGDAENPAHTEWRHQTHGYRDKYLYGPRYLDFVRRAPLNLFTAIFRTEREDDVFALSSFFPDLSAERDARASGAGKTRKPAVGRTPIDLPEIPRSPRRHGLRRVPDGFEVSRGDPGSARPETLRIRIAYDVRRGNPFTRYDPLDFDVANMALEHSGVSLEHLSNNEIRADVIADDFRLRVTGFDTRRDLIVRVAVQERPDER